MAGMPDWEAAWTVIVVGPRSNQLSCFITSRLVPKNFHLEICDFSFGYMHEVLNIIK